MCEFHCSLILGIRGAGGNSHKLTKVAGTIKGVGTDFRTRGSRTTLVRIILFLLLLTSLAQDLPDGPGKAEVLKLCQDCHDLDTITQENRTKEGWKKTVAKMGDRGAEGTDEQFETIVAYLTKNFGRTNVNKAPAEEIAAGVGFSKTEAEAIVRYREKNGPYKTWRELTAVEGLDAARVEAKKDHIAVQ